jgi:hypothetical protein
LVDDPHSARLATPFHPQDWPRRYPYHPSFGPRSTVSVPVPTAFPTAPSSASSGTGHVAPLDLPPSMDSSGIDGNPPCVEMPRESDSSSEDDGSYTTREHDKDLSRGMGHHLRLPIPASSTGSKRRHSRTTSDSPCVIPTGAPPIIPSDFSRSSAELSPDRTPHALRPLPSFLVSQFPNDGSMSLYNHY